MSLALLLFIVINVILREVMAPSVTLGINFAFSLLLSLSLLSSASRLIYVTLAAIFTFRIILRLVLINFIRFAKKSCT